MLKKLIEIANQHGYELIEASNASDLKNYRPGIAALKKFGIKSPFIEAGINKNQIRQLARKFKLPNWNRPSNACLATRIPYGRPIQKQVLKRIAQGEAYLKKLKIKQVRVRDHFPSTRIEIEEEQFSIILKNRMRVVRYFKKLGYRFITLDLAGYQTGSFDLKFRK